MARCYREEKKAAGAEEEFRRALALDPKLIRAHYGLGQALEMLGRKDEAQREFQLHSELLERSRASKTGISGSRD